jgi:hypothetical protein
MRFFVKLLPKYKLVCFLPDSINSNNADEIVSSHEFSKIRKRGGKNTLSFIKGFFSKSAGNFALKIFFSLSYQRVI